MRWFIAMRYFWAHKRQSLVCIAGVTIAVMVFLSMSSMMNGFTDKFIIETVESSGHITINDEPRETQTPILERAYLDPNALLHLEGTKPRDNIKKIKNAEGLIQQIRRLPGIVDAAPVVTGSAIATYGTKTRRLEVIGVDPPRQQTVTTIGTNMIEGDFDRLKTAGNSVVIGRGVADLLGAKVDDLISLSSETGGKATVKIVGIFQTGVTPVDYGRLYMMINNAQTLLDKKNIINQVIIRTDDYEKARDYAAQIESIIGYKTESWQEANSNFLKIFGVQQVITYIITGALLVVAAFGVLNILIMAVLERVNDIAILKSFGFSRQDVTIIYMAQGFVIAVIGATTGTVLGKILIEGLRRLPVKMEGMIKAEGILMSENLSIYVTAYVATLAIVTMAAIYPARRAAKYDPVEVIRGAH
jgi:lipoprotein-releasing system permease protein